MRQKIGHVPSSGSRTTSFSSDGRFIIVANSRRATVWDATDREIVFDSAITSVQSFSFSKAKEVIQMCGPSAHRKWPSCLRTSGAMSGPLTKLTVDSFYGFITSIARPENVKFCEDVLVANYLGMLGIFKLRK